MPRGISKSLSTVEQGHCATQIRESNHPISSRVDYGQRRFESISGRPFKTNGAGGNIKEETLARRRPSNDQVVSDIGEVGERTTATPVAGPSGFIGTDPGARTSTPSQHLIVTATTDQPQTINSQLQTRV